MNQTEQLTIALVMALTAPTDAQAKRASDLAEEISAGLTAEQVNHCKYAALAVIEFEETK